MTMDRVTANLPSRDLDATQSFCARPGCPRMVFLHDPDGSLWRVMEPEATT
ncbi:MAG: hypothetical protein AAGA28_16060 [Pseudomonadota bacterium]